MAPNTQVIGKGNDFAILFVIDNDDDDIFVEVSDTFFESIVVSPYGVD
jgi:hypothetical protein